ncbi:acyltransferase family protein [Natronoglycomyces albus]|uniref:Acyltransferase n=1 Tax=Natronoglycomyces albus TaxID=2811108 RepID=A0A895XMR7_9ACTN|nr:acyltransferase family protein [Natronoglycomyces albus]QSB05062.1 acyltransferase [Natronoglycomyces albus]
MRTPTRAPAPDWDATQQLPVVKRTATLPRGGSPHYYRPELDGLRAVAVLLVAAYHIWLGRISGGVDVFLLLTGFLITASLLRMAERDRKIHLGVYFGRLSSRLIPTAATVLLASLLITMFIVPMTRWKSSVGEILASALYFQNWKLAISSTDYLQQDQPASVVQHFWSLSIQGQFYVVWALLLIGVFALAARDMRRMRLLAGTAFGLIFAVSLAYSIYGTANNQVWTYFDTGARMWEFALGALFALFIGSISLPRQARLVLGWVGLLALVSCGMLVPDSTMFPGYIALWPTAAALLVIIAGTTHYQYGVDRFLTWAPIATLGTLGYGIFLWHWPLFIAFREISGEQTAGLFDGLGIIALSIILAYITKKAFDDGLRSLIPKRTVAQARWGLVIGISFIVPVLAVSLTWTQAIALDEQPMARITSADPEDIGTHPGALALRYPDSAAEIGQVPITPSPMAVRDDLPKMYEDDCHVGIDGDRARICEYGSDTPDVTLAVVGASRSAHWFPAIEARAEANNWRVLTITKSACLFTTGTSTYQGNTYHDCMAWRDDVVSILKDIQPDLVVTSSTRTESDQEYVPSGYIERWEELDELGLTVFGIRDTPIVDNDVVDCVARGDSCVYDTSHIPAEDPMIDNGRVPDNVIAADFTPYICPEQQCYAVIGNVLVYRDSRHISATYAATLAAMMEEQLLAALATLETD